MQVMESNFMTFSFLYVLALTSKTLDERIINLKSQKVVMMNETLNSDVSTQ